MAPLAVTRTRKTLVARAAVVALIAVLGLTVAAPANARQATHLTINIDDTFESDFWTDTCHTAVVISAEATLNVTLVYNKEGLLVREIDPAGGGTVTFSAPETGESFSFPFGATTFDYGAGAQVGSTFTAKSVGLLGHVPGLLASDAGQVSFTGVVSGFDANGSPLLEFEAVLVEHGHRSSSEEVAAAVCGALIA